MSDTNAKEEPVAEPSLTRPEIARAAKIAVGTFVMVFLAVWILIPVFWGSNYRLEYYFYRIAVDVYDFDSASNPTPLLGPTVAAGLKASMAAPAHFTFRFLNTTGVTIEQIEHGIVNEHAWAAVIINSNATSAWQAAVQGSVSTYDPNGAISVVVASARFYQVILEYLLPFLATILATPLTSASVAASATYFTSATPSTLAALTTAQSAALSTPFGSQTIDLRPISNGQWAGAAPLEAGLIYYVIFSFYVTLYVIFSSFILRRLSTDKLSPQAFFARAPLVMGSGKKKLSVRLHHYIALRLIPSSMIYFILSLWYSLVNVAFNVPMNGNGHSGLNSQAGFMVFWMLNFITLCSLGFAMESVFTLLTIKFFPLFLITWIILNVTSSFFPPSLMEDFYRFGYAMPFYHSTTADKCEISEPESNLFCKGARRHYWLCKTGVGATCLRRRVSTNFAGLRRKLFDTDDPQGSSVLALSLNHLKSNLRMESPEPAAPTLSKQKRKGTNSREHRRLSCEGCRRKKAKCSRSWPCVGCTMREELSRIPPKLGRLGRLADIFAPLTGQEDCVWRGAVPQPAVDTSQELIEAKAELQRLRTLVASLMEQERQQRLSELGNGQPPPPPPPADLHGAPYSPQNRTPDRDCEESSANASVWPSHAPPPHPFWASHQPAWPQQQSWYPSSGATSSSSYYTPQQYNPRMAYQSLPNQSFMSLRPSSPPLHPSHRRESPPYLPASPPYSFGHSSPSSFSTPLGSPTTQDAGVSMAGWRVE
ncbi:hypothetical protein P7C70_g5087, partial [Phenoliferia sp. Uapishka_3]